MRHTVRIIGRMDIGVGLVFYSLYPIAQKWHVIEVEPKIASEYAEDGGVIPGRQILNALLLTFSSGDDATAFMIDCIHEIGIDHKDMECSSDSHLTSV